MVIERLIAHLRMAEDDAKRFAASDNWGLARCRARDARWLRGMIEHHLDHRETEKVA